MPQFCGVSGFRYTGLSVSPQDWGENDFQASRKLTGNQNPPRSAAVNQCYLGNSQISFNSPSSRAVNSVPPFFVCYIPRRNLNSRPYTLNADQISRSPRRRQGRARTRCRGGARCRKQPLQNGRGTPERMGPPVLGLGPMTREGCDIYRSLTISRKARLWVCSCSNGGSTQKRLE